MTLKELAALTAEAGNDRDAAHNERLIGEFVAKAVAEEREACAKICDLVPLFRDAAEAIRSREASCLTPS